MFPPQLWRDAREEAADAERRDSAFETFGSDIDPDILGVAAENARLAGVSDRVKLFRLDAREVTTGGRRGTIVCNPPYGERIGSTEISAGAGASSADGRSIYLHRTRSLSGISARVPIRCAVCITECFAAGCISILSPPTKRAKGKRKGHELPICFGYLSVAFAFGIFSTGSGLSLLETLLISMTNVTSAGQLAGVPIIAAGGSLAELALAQLVINLRYALMSVSLSQKLAPDVRLGDRFVIAFVNTDEVYAVAASRPGSVGRGYMYGLIIPPFLGWSTGTLIGCIAGSLLPEMIVNALGIATECSSQLCSRPQERAPRSLSALLLQLRYPAHLSLFRCSAAFREAL